MLAWVRVRVRLDRVSHHCTGVVGFIEHGFTETGRELERYDFDYLGAAKYDYRDKGRPLAVLSDWQTFWYCLGMCLFTYYGYRSYPASKILAETLPANTSARKGD